MIPDPDNPPDMIPDPDNPPDMILKHITWQLDQETVISDSDDEKVANIYAYLSVPSSIGDLTDITFTLDETEAKAAAAEANKMHISNWNLNPSDNLLTFTVPDIGDITEDTIYTTYIIATPTDDIDDRRSKRNNISVLVTIDVDLITVDIGHPRRVNGDAIILPAEESFYLDITWNRDVGTEIDENNNTVYKFRKEDHLDISWKISEEEIPNANKNSLITLFNDDTAGASRNWSVLVILTYR